uniref:Uncharacterized protein n=1 Tax=Mus spicilegus TaxID=10103 RepID=A0A8C6MV24_MUSSI
MLQEGLVCNLQKLTFLQYSAEGRALEGETTQGPQITVILAEFVIDLPVQSSNDMPFPKERAIACIPLNLMLPLCTVLILFGMD